LVIDNFAFGRSRRDAIKQSTAMNGSDVTRTEKPSMSGRPQPQSDGRPTITKPRAGSSQRGDATGTIAYVRDDVEIRAISADGTGDRRLWTHKDLHEGLGLYELAWRPDGKELAFSSSHEAVASFYVADIYTIRPDGTGLRKLTNAPDITEFSRYPKGTVTVTVRNDQRADITSGSFIVYVAGADEPQQVTIPAGTAKTLVFKSVADFGSHPQPVVAMFGKYRWFTPGTDVQAGRNVTSPTFTITGGGIDMFGAFRPVWRSDGSKISYRSGLCVVSKVPVNPTPGEYSFDPLFGGKNPMGTCTWDWGPTPATANQVIYSENGSGGSSIYRMTESGTHPGTKLTGFSDIDYQLLYDLRWLPRRIGVSVLDRHTHARFGEYFPLRSCVEEGDPGHGSERRIRPNVQHFTGRPIGSIRTLQGGGRRQGLRPLDNRFERRGNPFIGPQWSASGMGAITRRNSLLSAV
jgi:TolB protein